MTHIIKIGIKMILHSKMLCLYLLLFLSVTTAIAQEQKVTLSRQTLTRREAMAEITNQTGYYFAVNHAFFDDGGSVYFSSLTLPFREALNQLLKNTDHTFVIQGMQVLVLSVADKAKKEKADEPKKVKQNEPRKEVKPYVPPKEAKQKSDYAPFYDSSAERRAEQEPVTSYSSDFERGVENNMRRTVTVPAEKNTEIQIPAIRERKDTVRKETVKREKRVVQSAGETNRIASQKLSFIPSKQPNRAYQSYLTEPPARFSVKTNLLYGIATLTPNLALEIGLSRKWSLELAVGWNSFGKDESEGDEDKLNHMLIKPELRYWLCERSNGHFLGVHPIYADFDVSGKEVPLLFEKDYRYKGNAYGVGVSYGYHWMLSKRWGLEFNIGVGGLFLNYDKFCREVCTDKEGSFEKKYFGPTSAGLKVVYILK
ncbi:MAG: DUF3575 domain-containing protein [Bacteroides sp.]|nr:DUF3575 domain-containing protein [Bacteroides sp.]